MRIGLYAHGGSGNHGCEAVARSTMRFHGKHEYTLFSECPDEDFRYGLGELASIVPSQNDLPRGLGQLAYYIRMMIAKNDNAYWSMRYRDFSKKIKGLDLALAIGGDNYCYNGFLERFAVLNRIMVSEGIPIILWGCSIDRDRISPALIEDLKLYRLIIARESITYSILQDAGFLNVKLMPDTAFLMEGIDTRLPEGFIPDNMVGLNISPLIIRKEKAPETILLNCRKLIEYILSETDMGVALIPHVVWNGNDDREPLHKLYNEYVSSGRIVMVNDADAPTLKGIIQKCRFMIAARTHASIAAYSTGVPTIVLGYSVKSKGIAMDLFGTYENYVLSIEELNNGDELREAFKWMLDHEMSIRDEYVARLDSYMDGFANPILDERVF